MKARINNPALRDLGPLGVHGRSVFELLEPLTYHLPVAGGFYNGGIVVEVPKGYQTDFASVPRGLWNIFPPMGKHSRAAIIHDYLYTEDAGCSRFLADAIFRDVMADLGVPLWRRVTMYYAVHAFGWIGWKGSRRSD